MRCAKDANLGHHAPRAEQGRAGTGDDAGAASVRVTHNVVDQRDASACRVQAAAGGDLAAALGGRAASQVTDTPLGLPAGASDFL